MRKKIPGCKIFLPVSGLNHWDQAFLLLLFGNNPSLILPIWIAAGTFALTFPGVVAGKYLYDVFATLNLGNIKAQELLSAVRKWAAKKEG